jgi:hypothetical protein
MLGDSRLHEAALVNHLASALIRESHTVWPESPFRNFASGSTKHLDLLVDFAPRPPHPILALFECKCVSPGFEADKIAEIIEDHGRVCRWPLLMPQGQPVFFLFSPPSVVYGVLAVMLIENLGKPSKRASNCLSGWWKEADGPAPGVPSPVGELLRDRLRRASRRGTVPGEWTDGGIVYTVAYAVYELQLAREEDLLQTAQHSAAQAVVAVKSGLHVSEIQLNDDGKSLSGTTILDWKKLKGTLPDRELVIRALASSYAGDAIDELVRSRAFEEPLKKAFADSIELAEVREFASDCGLAGTPDEFAKLSDAGYDRALDLIKNNCELIEELATESMLKMRISEPELTALLPLLETLRKTNSDLQ